MENFLQLITQLQAVVAKMEEQSADFPAELQRVREEALEDGKRSRDEEISDLIDTKDQEKAEFGASEYTRGFSDGVASVPECPVSDKVYTQEELDAAVQTAVEAATGPLNETVAAMQVEIDRLNGELSSVDQRISDAIATFKAELLSRYDATQEDDAAFRESLK